MIENEKIKKGKKHIMCNKKYLVVTIILLIISFSVGGKTIINNSNTIINITKELFQSSELSVSEKIANFINKTNNIYSNNLSLQSGFVEVYGETQKLINKKLIDDVKTGYILKDEEGFLHFPSYKTDTTVTANMLSDINDYFTEQNIPFCFILALSKDIDGYTTFKDGIDTYANSKYNYENFINSIDKKGINYLNLNSSSLLSDIGFENAFYKTDHHWKTETAFLANQQIIKFINDTYEFDIDKDGYYTDLNNYNVQTLKNSFLGSLGKRMGIAYSGVDDYTLITPKFDTDMQIYKGYKQVLTKEGTFYDTIVDKEKCDITSPINTNRYATYFGQDDDFITVVNNNADNDYKVLIIKDSYALPVAAFMSLSVNKLTLVDVRLTKEQSIKDFINENDYDFIINLYGIGSICGKDMFEIK